MFAAAIAHHLDSLGLVDYRPSAEGGDCFVEQLPSDPDSIVAVFGSGGAAQPTRLAYDLPTFQIRTRGPRFDPLASASRQAAIYDALVCLDGAVLAAGTPHEIYVVGISPIQAARDNPVPLGLDTGQRPEHSLNYQATTRSVTTHRQGVLV